MSQLVSDQNVRFLVRRITENTKIVRHTTSYKKEGNMTTASRFVRRQLAQLPRKYARLPAPTALAAERRPAITSELSVIEQQFLEFIEIPSDNESKAS